MGVEYGEWFVGGVLDISALLMYAKSEYLIGLCRVMKIFSLFLYGLIGFDQHKLPLSAY